MTIDSKNWTSQPTSGARLVLGVDAPVRPLGHPADSVPINLCNINHGDTRFVIQMIPTGWLYRALYSTQSTSLGELKAWRECIQAFSQWSRLWVEGLLCIRLASVVVIFPLIARMSGST